jgi:ATP-dependent RNA helicase RhlE
VPEDYVHRIGRTGRADSEGIAISLVCVDEQDFLKDIEKLIKRDIEKEIIKGFEPDPSIRAEPIVLGRSMTIGRNNGGGAGNGRAGSKPSFGAKPRSAGQHATSGKPSGKPTHKPASNRAPKPSAKTY